MAAESNIEVRLSTMIYVSGLFQMNFNWPRDWFQTASYTIVRRREAPAVRI